MYPISQKYFNASTKLPKKYYSWPLYGSGIKNLGQNSKPVIRDIPKITHNELLMRIDACGLCYTDVKAVMLGSNHPRFIGKNLKKNPVVPGHELTMTVVNIGADLKNSYRIGDRYTMQPNVWINGRSVPFCFGMDGGFRQYTKIGPEILNGDEGNYLIPIPKNITYAASALAEPWSCVEASYRMVYRDKFKNNGVVWFCGSKHTRYGFIINSAWGSNHNPSKVIVTSIPDDLRSWIKCYCRKNKIDFVELSIQNALKSNATFDDIIILDCPADVINSASLKLNKSSVLAICNKEPLKDRIKVDMGNLHYDMVVYVGTTTLCIDDAYNANPICTHLKPNGYTWFLGAGGPLGRMHLQRAIDNANSPRKVFATNRGTDRLQSLKDSFLPLAEERGVELVALSPTREINRYHHFLEKIASQGGFDDIIVMAPNAQIVEESLKYLAKKGVLNLFAGINRGIKASINAWDIYGPKQIRLVGHSGSNLNDQIHTVNSIINGELQPQRAVAAIGGLNQVPDGIKAMIDKKFPGKIIIYPHIIDFPITSLPNLKNILPRVYELLDDGQTWTFESEREFIESHVSI